MQNKELTRRQLLQSAVVGTAVVAAGFRDDVRAQGDGAGAPAASQALSLATCSVLSMEPSPSGGMRSSLSVVVMRSSRRA